MDRMLVCGWVEMPNTPRATAPLQGITATSLRSVTKDKKNKAGADIVTIRNASSH
jgi:hypothetical protein